MLESITSKMLVSGGLIGVSLMIIFASLWIAEPRREKKGRHIDVEEAVRNAPYHLLDDQ